MQWTFGGHDVRKYLNSAWIRASVTHLMGNEEASSLRTGSLYGGKQNSTCLYCLAHRLLSHQVAARTAGTPRTMKSKLEEDILLLFRASMNVQRLSWRTGMFTIVTERVALFVVLYFTLNAMKSCVDSDHIGEWCTVSRIAIFVDVDSDRKHSRFLGHITGV